MRYALAAALLLAACDDDAADPTLTVLEPFGAAELAPGGTIEMAWEIEGRGDLRIDLDPLRGETRFTIFAARDLSGPGTFTWDGRDLDGAAVPVDVYDAVFVLGVPEDEAIAEERRSVAVHGVEWVAPVAGETVVVTGSEVAAEPAIFTVLTVSHREVLIRYRLDPDLETADDEILIRDTSIPGEFVPFERPIPFDGVDTSDEPVPAGVYTLVADVDDRDGEFAYRAVGGDVDWRPGE